MRFYVKQGQTISIDTVVYKRNGFDDPVTFSYAVNDPQGLAIDITPDDTNGSSNLTVRTIINVGQDAAVGVRTITLDGTPHPVGVQTFEVEILAASSTVPDQNPISLDFTWSGVDVPSGGHGFVTVTAATTSGTISMYEWSTPDTVGHTIGTYTNIPANQPYVTTSEIINVWSRTVGIPVVPKHPKMNLTLTARTTTGLSKTISKLIELEPDSAYNPEEYVDGSNIVISGPTITNRGGWFDAQGVDQNSTYQFIVDVEDWINGGWVKGRDGQITITSAHGANSGISFDINPSTFNLAVNGPRQTVTVSNIKFNPTTDMISNSGYPAIALYVKGTRGSKKINSVALTLTAKPLQKSNISVSFSATQVSGQPTTYYSFVGSAGTDIGNITGNYVWNFGDGTSYAGPERTVTHNFPGAGTYTVTLTVTDTTGNTKSFTSGVNVVSGSVQQTFAGPGMYKHPDLGMYAYRVFGIKEGSSYTFRVAGVKWNNKTQFSGSVYVSNYGSEGATIYPTNVTVNMDGSATVTISNIRYSEQYASVLENQVAYPSVVVQFYSNDPSVAKAISLEIFRENMPWSGYSVNSPGVLSQ